MRATSNFNHVSPISNSALGCDRVQSDGKFLVKGGERFFVKGVTYGTFRPNGIHRDYPNPQVVENDFSQMRNSGINTVRLYTVPPRWVLDCAQDNGLSVIVGLPWSQHIAFLNDRASRRAIIRAAHDGVSECAGHPAVLAYTVGNEIPTQVVRWHGAKRIERFLAELYRTAKELDPEALVTYANYPSTEYLVLPFMDFSFYNVYLQSTSDLDAYISRLQTLSGNKPLVLGELGLDSRSNGEVTQANTLHDQVTTAFSRGCAGVCVFSWSDEWHRGGVDVEDWDFGLTRRQRSPKPALESVRRAFETVPPALDDEHPRISVVVCSYNGASTIRDCLDGLAFVDYPDFEVIVVNDGSSDATASIASEYDVRLITTPNQGLSAARNVGMQSATGEIIAYIDDDTRPDPHWLSYLARTFQTTSHAAVGGPNLAPDGDGFTAEAVDNAPGNPVHVLVEDDLAEHIPGCNMAVRKLCLEAIGGFDPQFRVAGDDVDMCWRLHERGWTIGYSPTAVVWHHRRNSIREFWRQQIGYGRAEALLERKWPDKYNRIGHPIWSGHVYGNGRTPRFWNRQRIYQGVWGSAAYQSADETPPSRLESLLTMPEWYLLLGALFLLTALTPIWTRMALIAPVLTIAMTTTVILASRGTDAAQAMTSPAPAMRLIALRALTTFLYLLQPAGRLWGRVSEGLTPWRHHSTWGYAWPRSMSFSRRSDVWYSTAERLNFLQADLQRAGYIVRCGEPFDRWDLEIRGGLSAATRIQLLVEEHGWGKQFIRFRFWPRFSRTALVVVGFLAALSAIAIWDRAWSAAAVLGFLAIAMAAQIIRQAAGACGAARTAVQREIALSEQRAPVDVDVGDSSSLAISDMSAQQDRHQPITVSAVMLERANKQQAFTSDGDGG